MFVADLKFRIIMGKKMGMNSKAVAAKERKNEKAASEKAAKEAALEDEKWRDDGNPLAKKQVNLFLQKIQSITVRPFSNHTHDL